MSSRTLKPIAVMNEIPPEPLPSFAPLTHKKPQAGGMEANGPKSKAVKSQSGRSQGVTVSTVCTSLEGIPVDFRRTGAPSPPPAAADFSGASIATIIDPISAKERTLLPITGKRSTKGAVLQNAYVFSSSPPPDKDMSSSQQQAGRDERVRWATTRNPPKTKVTKSLQQQYTSVRNTNKPTNNNGGGDEAGNNSRHVDIQPSVVSGKQWEFKMPDAPEPTLTSQNTTEGLESAGAPVNTSSSENANGQATLDTSLSVGNKNVRFQKPTQRNVVGPHIRTQGKMVKSVQRTAVKGRAQVPAGSIFEMVVAGQHRLGTFDDDTATTYTLASLESAVARQRRLREEIANVQKQVLSGFRSVVRTFVAYQSVHVDTPLQTLSALDGVKLSNTQKTIKKGAFTFSIPLAKCSVVVHTLATTIQRYARFRHSNALVALIQKGDNKLEAARSLASRSMGIAPLDASALLSLAPYTPSSHDGDRSISSAWSENLRHEEVLDSNTIAQLKQLYFAYYDCESYVLDFADDTSPTAKRLGMSANDATDVHNVIEEANVLVAGFEEMEGDVEEEEVLEGEGSMMFNEAKEWNQIYSDDDERSTSGSSISCDYVDDDVPSDVAGPDDEEISENDFTAQAYSVSSSVISAPKLAVRHHWQAAHPPTRHVSPPLREVHSGSTIECCDVVEETPVRTAGSSKGFRSLRWQRPSRESSQAPVILSDEEVIEEAV
jgi:hypothetical protein